MKINIFIMKFKKRNPWTPFLDVWPDVFPFVWRPSYISGSKWLLSRHQDNWGTVTGHARQHRLRGLVGGHLSAWGPQSITAAFKFSTTGLKWTWGRQLRKGCRVAGVAHSATTASTWRAQGFCARLAASRSSQLRFLTIWGWGPFETDKNNGLPWGKCS